MCVCARALAFVSVCIMCDTPYVLRYVSSMQVLVFQPDLLLHIADCTIMYNASIQPCDSVHCRQKFT